MSFKWILPVILCTASVSAEEWGRDKIAHATLSGVIGASTQMYTEDWRVSMSICTSVGLVKELYDEYDYGGFDDKDLLADLVGCSVGIILGDTALQVWSKNDSLGIQYNWSF